MTTRSIASSASIAPTAPGASTGDWPPGYRIGPRAPRLPDELIAAFRTIPVAVAGDCMGRSVGATGLHGYHEDLGAVLCGPAVTVRVRPGDNLMIHKALMLVQPGDVLVIDGGGDVTQALMGGLMRTTCLVKQLGGLVIDGALRDRLEWAEGGLPVFARGHTHRGPAKEGPGEINVPVACAGLSVLPGDLVLGDADGVIAIPAADAALVLQRARLHLEKEASIRAANLAGTSDPERFDAALRAKGLPV
ncbi:RraA family protein [Acidovorax sp. Leaf160]|uniref:RraA family protein n=1 Tax=Acidovorax sp. Leaf160 TaxID=1736280 RepID=UPI0009EA1D75|nr:RraA family protein [Acidovorax sp. Leaf160]